mmetsp:Transcript_19043/g.45773  ORF Transcript_19043/g.45773 Transcript_19043/m.45773 type:complete len:203 (-) Transcript_19043:685-1293(-)
MLCWRLQELTTRMCCRRAQRRGSSEGDACDDARWSSSVTMSTSCCESSEAEEEEDEREDCSENESRKPSSDDKSTRPWWARPSGALCGADAASALLISCCCEFAPTYSCEGAISAGSSRGPIRSVCEHSIPASISTAITIGPRPSRPGTGIGGGGGSEEGRRPCAPSCLRRYWFSRVRRSTRATSARRSRSRSCTWISSVSM